MHYGLPVKCICQEMFSSEDTAETMNGSAKKKKKKRKGKKRGLFHSNPQIMLAQTGEENLGIVHWPLDLRNFIPLIGH